MLKKLIWAIALVSLSCNISADSMTLTNQSTQDLWFDINCPGYVFDKTVVTNSNFKTGQTVQIKWGGGVFQGSCKNAPTTIQLYDKGGYNILTFGPSVQQYGQKYYVHSWKNGDQCVFYVSNKDKNAPPVDAGDPGYFDSGNTDALPCR